MLNCPKCDSDLVDVDSSIQMQESVASCTDCGFSIQKRVPEERIEEIWDECKSKVNKILYKYSPPSEEQSGIATNDTQHDKVGH